MISMKTLRTLLLIGFLTLVPILTFAQTSGSGTVPSSGSGVVPVGLTNPIKGVDSIYKLVSLVLNNIIIPIGSVVVVIMIIYSGFLFVTARGNPDKIEDAKRTLLYVVIGAAILLGASVISLAIGGTLCQISPTLPGCPNLGALPTP